MIICGDQGRLPGKGGTWIPCCTSGAGPSVTPFFPWDCPWKSFENYGGTSLVVQWLRICLPMQGTRVRALVREDATCRRATKSVRHWACALEPASHNYWAHVHHNYWACALEPVSHNYWSPRTWSACSATREATAMRSPRTTTKSNPRSPQLEKAHVQQRRPNAAKN